MRYVSTRGTAPVLDFDDTVRAGLANDGGLYVPEHWPLLQDPLPSGTYAQLAEQVMWPYVAGSISPRAWELMCLETYATFRHPAVCPLVQIGDDEWLLELFHGPTLAFKDVALQLVGRVFDYVLGARGDRVTIVGATSGDTGSAAIEAIRGRAHADIVMLFPAGRVSDVQRRQMTTVDAPNVRAVAVEGTFDDCQDLVKAMFNDEPFRARMRLSAVNSINWARVMAQIVYYVAACRALGASATRPVRFSVPTGNFGNVFSGWVAREMGLPIEQFVVGSNTNDIVARLVDTGVMVTRPVVPTLSPSMDIQVSSNVERLLFELNGRDGGLTAEQMKRFRTTAELSLEADQHDTIRSVFAAARVDDDATIVEMAVVHGETGLLVDPHTAVGLAAARVVAADPGVATVTLATAHPAKFPDAVERATGVRPELPEHLSDLLERRERYDTIPNELAAIEHYVENTFIG
jgi:threonine synthase